MHEQVTPRGPLASRSNPSVPAANPRANLYRQERRYVPVVLLIEGGVWVEGLLSMPRPEDGPAVRPYDMLDHPNPTLRLVDVRIREGAEVRSAGTLAVRRASVVCMYEAAASRPTART